MVRIFCAGTGRLLLTRSVIVPTLLLTVPVSSTCATEPGDGVEWTRCPEHTRAADPRWGPVLTDIERRLDAKHGDKYRHDDPVTHGHETSHAIAADLRTAGRVRTVGFYCLTGRAAVLIEPAVRLSQVAATVPVTLRGPLFEPYLKAEGWDDSALYVLDEWTAYLNGAAVWHDQRRHGLVNREADALFGPREFAPYALALCLAVETHDPNYLSAKSSGRQFREFMAYCLKRCGELCGASLPDTEAAAELRRLALRWYGREFCEHYVFSKSGAEPREKASEAPTAPRPPSYADQYTRALRERLPLLVEVGECPAELVRRAQLDYPNALRVRRDDFPGVTGPCVVVSEPRSGWLEWIETRRPTAVARTERSTPPGAE